MHLINKRGASTGENLPRSEGGSERAHAGRENKDAELAQSSTQLALDVHRDQQS